MTATEVNGVPVVSTSILQTPIGIDHKRCVLLHLADGTTTVGCTHADCVHTGDSAQSVSHHSKVVHDGWVSPLKGRRIAAEKAGQILAEFPLLEKFRDMTFGELIGLLEDYADDSEILEKRIAKLVDKIADLEAVNKDLRKENAEYKKAFDTFRKFV